MTLLLFIAEPLEVSRSFALQYPCVISSEGGLLTMSSLTDQWYDGVASNHKPPCRKSPTLKGSVVRAWKEKALACALRKKAALFRDANRAVVLEIVRWAIIANHPRMVRYGFVQLRRALSPKKSTKISMSVFSRLFLFYRVFGVFLGSR